MSEPARLPLEQHPHPHDRFCGHAAVPHEGHVDFFHDGHVHHVHEDRVDAAPTDLVGHHLPHAGHMHVHAEGCGHTAVPHGDQLDYVHGSHGHAGHHVHYDEH